MVDSPPGTSPAPPAVETPEQTIARLKAENAALQNAAEPGISEPVPEPVAPLAALAASVEANKDLTFVEHLKLLADDGIKAVISPSIEADVLGALAAIVADIAKVKL